MNVQRPCSMAIVFFLVSLFRFLLRFWEPLIFRIIHCSCWIECWQKNSIPVFVYLGFFAKKKVIARLAYDHTKRGYGHTKHTFNILVQLSPLLLSHTHSFLICYLKLSFFYTFAHLTHLAWNLSKYLRIRVRKMGREGSFWWIINEMKFQWTNSATFTLNNF